MAFLEVANAVVDAVFWVDIILHFITVQQDIATGAYVTDRRVIAKRYAKGSLAIDMVASFPIQLLYTPRMRMMRMLRPLFF